MLQDIRIRQRESLIRMAQIMSQELDMDTLSWRVIQMALDIVGGESGFVALYSEKNGWQIRATYDLSESATKYIETYLSHSYEKESTGDQSALMQINMMIKRMRSIPELKIADGIGLPLSLHDRLIGIILVFRSYKVNFTLYDRNMLKAFTEQASIAVRNAFLYNENIAEKNRMEAVINSTADGIAVISVAHRIEKVNPALLRMLGGIEEEILGMNHKDYFRFSSIESGMELDEAEAGGWPFNSESKLTIDGDLISFNGGEAQPVSITYTPVMDENHHLVNIIALVRDIRKFREADNLKNTFISTISHELKTPVAIIKGYASTLNLDDADWDPAIIRDSLSVIEEEADRLTAMINNLLDASRITSGALKLRKSYFDLPELCGHVAARLQKQHPNHTVVCDFPKDFPLVYADDERIEQVVTNLLSNAIKYAPNGEIRIQGRTDEKTFSVSVMDEGPGMSSDDLQHVFERFFRASKTANTAKGTGLGLFLCDAIIKAHNGKIYAEQRKDRSGTVFTFILPLEDMRTSELKFEQ